MKKRIILLVLASVMVCAASISGAVAYFSESKEVNNIITTSTLGVGIEDDDNTSVTIADIHMLPGVNIDRDVVIKNTDKETEYVKVTVTKYWAEDNTQDCTKRKDNLDAAVIDVINENTDDWIILSSEEIEDDNNETLILFYKKPLKKDEKTSKVVDSLKISSDIDNSYTDANLHLDIAVEAVQASNAKEAISGEWGIDVTIDKDGLLEEVVY